MEKIKGILNKAIIRRKKITNIDALAGEIKALDSQTIIDNDIVYMAFLRIAEKNAKGQNDAGACVYAWIERYYKKIPKARRESMVKDIDKLTAKGESSSRCCNQNLIKCREVLCRP